MFWEGQQLGQAYVIVTEEAIAKTDAAIRVDRCWSLCLLADEMT